MLGWWMCAALAAEPAPPVVSLAPGKGLTVRSADDRFSLGIRSRIVPRVDLSIPRFEPGEAPDLQTRATIATARIWLQGHIFTPKLTWLTQLAVAGRDYRDGATSPIFDAYVDWKPTRDLNLRAGQYFVPFDRLRTVREFALQMTDRPRPVSELTLDRDIGVMAYSDHFLGDRSPVAWRVGVFGGQGSNAVDLSDAGGLFVGRVELRPLGDIDDDSEGDLDNREKPGLALGGGVAYNLNTQRTRSTTGGRYVGGTVDYLHAVGDVVFKWRGLAIEGEYVTRQAADEEIQSTNADGEAVVEYARSGSGVVAQASYHVAPGYEFVGRYSRIWATDGTDPKFVSEVAAKGNEVGTGFNVYVNGHRFKWQTSWTALFGEDGFGSADHLVSTQLDMMF